MVVSSITGVTASSTVAMTEVPKTESGYVEEMSKAEIERMMSTEQYVKKYFSDLPIMIQVAKCESRFRQLDQNGEVHRGVVNNKDVGVMQINEYYHLEESKKMNLDIYTIEGNTKYARHLFEQEGTRPWSSSKPCWGKYENKELAVNTK